MLDEEADIIQGTLHEHRMRGNCTFNDDPEHYEQDGNVYVEVTCNDITEAAGVRNAFTTALDDERVQSFRGPDTKNPATEEVHVYVVAEPPF